MTFPRSSYFRFIALCCLILGSSVSAIGQTINSIQVLNRGNEASSTYLIAADSVDGDANTNRHYVTCSSSVTFPSAGTYRLRYQLIDSSGDVLTEVFKALGSVSAGATINDSSDITSFPSRIGPYERTRLKVEVARREATGSPPPFDFAWFPQASQTEATGRAYYHFPSVTTGDPERNVIAQMTGATLAVRRYLVDSVSGNEYIHAAAGFRLLRYDAWDSIVSVATNIAVTLKLELRRVSDDGVIQVLNDQGNAADFTERPFTVSISPWVSQSGIKVPVTVTASDVDLLDLRLDPAEWLDFDEQYYVKVTVLHEEVLGQPKVTGNAWDTSDAQFFHFTGKLIFGAINTQFTALNGSITTVNVAEPRLNVPVAQDAGGISGTELWTFGTGQNLEVLLKPGGDAVFKGMSVEVSGPTGEPNLLNGVQYSFENLVLTQSGLVGNVSAWMPVGSGYSSTLTENRLQNKLGPVGSVALNQSLAPTSSVAFSGSPKFFVHEETKPFKTEASVITWSPSLGRFTLNATAVHSLRRPLVDAMETIPGLANEFKTKASNDAYWNEVATINTTPYLQASVTGAAQLHATVNLLPNRFFSTHFPKNTSINWTSGVVQIQGDSINSANSSLEGVAGVTVPYGRHCTEVVDECPGGEKSFYYYRINPDSSRLRFTPDGGLHGSGATAFSHLISWGVLNEESPAAHEAVTPFQRGSFLMSGHFLPTTLLPFGSGLTPAYIHLRGVDPANLTQSELPGSAAYVTGTGDYAGMNLRAPSSDAACSFRSRLGGSLSDAYELTSNSKFYLRYGGVSGVQQALGGLSSATGLLMGYPVVFDTFGLSWLSNENILSRTDGSLLVPEPSDFTLAFDDLTFTCLGAPSIGGMAGGSLTEDLDYWQAPFTAFGLEFKHEGICDPSAGFLTVAMRLAAKNISQPLTGVLGFRQNGQVIRPADHLADITSELPLPAVFRVDGPKRTSESPAESYAFTPTRWAYLNHEAADSRPPDVDRVGFWNLVGRMDVPFFEDLKVHAHTSANPAEPLASLHVTGGWGEMFTDRDFDAAHVGFTGSSPASYRSSEAHRTHAHQLWLGLLDFNYPLQWNSARRTFKSPSTVPADLLIMEAQHRVDYLSPDQTEISFGVEYTGLPRISISNALTNLVDENVGVASSLARSAGDQVLAGIEGGVDGFADLLTDRLDAMLAETVAGVVNPGLEVFFVHVKAAAGEAVAAQQDVRQAVKDVVDTYLRPSREAADREQVSQIEGPPLVPISTHLASWVGDLDTQAGLVPSLNLRLSGIETSLFAFAGDADDLENPLPNAGVLGRDAFGSRAVLDALVQNLVTDLAPQYVNVIQSAPRFTFIQEAEGALSQIQASFLDIREAISALRKQLDFELPNHGFLDQLTDLQTQLDIDLQGLVLEALADAVQAYLDEVLNEATSTFPTEAEMNAYLDRLREDIESRVRRELLTRLMATPAIRGVQEALRAKLQVVHLAYREAVDAAFDEVNQIIRKALTGALSGLDDTLNGYAKGLGDVIQAGRITGHAHIQGEALRELRLDARLQLGIPDETPLRFDGYARFQQLDSVGPGGCPDMGGPSPVSAGEVTLGARNTSLEWLSPGVQADVEATVGFYAPQGVPLPISVGGRFETVGSMGFGGAEVTDVKGTVKIGMAPGQNGLVLGENYVGLAGAVRLSGSGLEGCIFLGRACTLEPILFLNPQLGNVLGSGGFTGGYVFGAGRLPIVDFGCLLNLSAGIGAGVFYAAEGPTWGGEMQMSASGEALCVISVRGDVNLIGVKRGDDFRFSGQGRIKGKIGVCPFCKRFNKTVRFTYQGGSWDADY
ncbi:hypothetical protein SAMN02745166_04452 [Prosthecobacter debontii]|uniref:Uncharacterized protein n=1 Tax=Prosthecobacter debontii TaxID=48467 RepID=A0A1T4YX43_9BACT|nr:hypothetical protein [Prosthecobacter debontii]SKB06342.1 hypothetical protein SAMN02745166_04452 [Prosthecobacter debontii]